MRPNHFFLVRSIDGAIKRDGQRRWPGGRINRRTLDAGAGKKVVCEDSKKECGRRRAAIAAAASDAFALQPRRYA